MFRVDIGNDPARLLGVGHRMECDRSLAARFLAKDLDDPAPRQTTSAECDIETERAIHFENQIAPIFTRFGCNAGGCHGKAGGQNGFALSLLGFEPQEDYEYIVKEAARWTELIKGMGISVE